jgi:hypothetical protein
MTAGSRTGAPFVLRRLMCLGIMLAVAATCAAAVPSASFAFRTGVGCHGPFRMPGQSIHSLTFDAVQVRARQRMSCYWALHIAAKARWLAGLKVIYGPQFGGGGWGGPFHVSHWHCYVLGRGSDFIDARCRWRGRAVHFYDHRSNWNFPDPGFDPPTRYP